MEVAFNTMMMVTVNTNNGAETTNKDFKYQNLHRVNDNLLNKMIIMVEEQFPRVKFAK